MIRSAVPGDAPAITAVQLTTYRAEYGGWLPDQMAALDPAGLTAAWRRSIDDETHRVAVAEVAGEVVGYTLTIPPTTEILAPGDDPAHVGEIDSLYVRPDHHGHGLGRALVTDALDALTAADRATCLLWALERHAASRGFYERVGFRLDDDSGGRGVWRGLTKIRYRYAAPGTWGPPR